MFLLLNGQELFYGISTLFGLFNSESSHFDIRLFVCLVVLFYGIPTLLGSFNAESGHFFYKQRTQVAVWKYVGHGTKCDTCHIPSLTSLIGVCESESYSIRKFFCDRERYWRERDRLDLLGEKIFFLSCWSFYHLLRLSSCCLVGLTSN